MSRIGKKPIPIPAGVTVTIGNDSVVVVKGVKGQNRVILHPKVTVSQADGSLQVAVQDPNVKQEKALWGLFRALLANAVQGVAVPFEKKLEMVGVGYKAALQGRNIVLEVGFSHPVAIELPEGITGTVEKNMITLVGCDKNTVGQIAAQIRAVRKPEPYKGKGIKYVGEIIRRKAGKAAKAAGAK